MSSLDGLPMADGSRTLASQSHFFKMNVLECYSFKHKFHRFDHS